MTGIVISGMDKEQDIWTEETEAKSAHNGIKEDYNRIISKNDMVVGLETTGITAAKDNAIYLLCKITLKITKAMSAYAKSRNDLVLLPKVEHSYTSLSRGPELEVIARCASILDLAQENLEKFTSYKVTQEKIDAGRQLINTYDKHSGDRGTTRSSITVGFSELDNQMAELKKKFDILDDTIESLIEDESFLARYNSWRMIIDYGKGKTLKNKPENNQSESSESQETEKIV